MPIKKSSEETIESTVEMLTAMANPHRLKMLFLLCSKNCNVSGIWKELGITQPLACQHLDRMYSARLVSRERKGQRTIYSLKDKRLEKILNGMLGLFPNLKKNNIIREK